MNATNQEEKEESQDNESQEEETIIGFDIEGAINQFWNESEQYAKAIGERFEKEQNLW